MTASEKIEKILNYLNINAKAFSEVLGYERPQIIYDIQKGKTKRISSDLSNKITSVFPQFNRSWLLADEGEMLNTGHINQAEPRNFSEDNQEIFEGTYREDEVPERYISYLVPMSAMGGSLSGFDEEGVRREDCERVVSPVADVDWVVPVCGDSMEPEYPNGSRVYVRQINPGDFIAWGNVYVLDTTNGLIIKVVVESERANCVRCVSLNPSGRYTPFDVQSEPCIVSCFAFP